MKITRTSRITGVTHTLDVPITGGQLARFYNGALVQDAFPDLEPPLREFILSGITPEEWQHHVAEPSAKPKPEYVACECGERSLPIEQMSCTEDGAWVCRECLADLAKEQAGG